MTVIFETSFEGIGIESGYAEYVGDGCTVDWDSTDVAPPSGGGSEILKCISAPDDNMATIYYESGGNAVSYYRVYFRIAAHNLGNGFSFLIARGESSVEAAWGVYLYNDNGTLRLYHHLYNDGTDEFGYLSSTFSGEVTLGMWHRLEVKYDATAEEYEFRLDGASWESGSLTGTFYSSLIYFLCGIWDQWDDGTTGTAYFDLFSGDDSDWIGPPSPTAAITGTATESIDEADIVAGGKTIIITLTNDEWIAA